MGFLSEVKNKKRESAKEVLEFAGKLKHCYPQNPWGLAC